MKSYFNTVRTTLGYVLSMMEKASGVSFRANDIDKIYNYHRVNLGSTFLRTSGQPSARQFEAVKKVGVTTVINLAPHHAENALEDEAGLLKALNIEYVHLPVDFQRPSDDDFLVFRSHLENFDLKTTWLHCAANMRASAFLFRYRCEVLGHSRDDARKDLIRIWEPLGVWANFIENRVENQK